MGSRLSPDAGLLFRNWLASARGGFLKWARALASRPGPASPAIPSADALKDIGLSRSDLPAICAGLIDGDNTRRQR